jgi:phosphoribosyl 1,2-cyclic phosphodiesterase
VLLDCGFSCREMENRLADLGVDPHSVNAILISHEHSDHLRGASRCSDRWGASLWMSHGTCRGARLADQQFLHLFHPDQASFRIGDLQIKPFTVPHDAREPCQYQFAYAGLKLSVLTDAGCATPHVLEMLDGIDALILETNHDEQMLINGPYHWGLKRRVGGDLGHLSNRQAAEILQQLDRPRLQHLVAAHLSDKNNSPDKAWCTLLDRAGDMEDRSSMLQQDRVSNWFDVLA